jgi:hypothetical protein
MIMVVKRNFACTGTTERELYVTSRGRLRVSGGGKKQQAGKNENCASHASSPLRDAREPAYGRADVVAETERLQAGVVRRRVGVDPVGLWVDVQIDDLRQSGRLRSAWLPAATGE